MCVSATATSRSVPGRTRIGHNQIEVTATQEEQYQKQWARPASPNVLSGCGQVVEG